MCVEYKACTYFTYRAVYNHWLKGWQTIMAEIGESQDVRCGPFNQVH